MAFKKKIKDSEARIAVYLKTKAADRCYLTAISSALGIEYGYLMRIMRSMELKGWVTSVRNAGTRVYRLESQAIFNESVKLLEDRKP